MLIKYYLKEKFCLDLIKISKTYAADTRIEGFGSDTYQATPKKSANIDRPSGVKHRYGKEKAPAPAGSNPKALEQALLSEASTAPSAGPSAANSASSIEIGESRYHERIINNDYYKEISYKVNRYSNEEKGENQERKNNASLLKEIYETLRKKIYNELHVLLTKDAIVTKSTDKVTDKCLVETLRVIYPHPALGEIRNPGSLTPPPQ